MIPKGLLNTYKSAIYSVPGLQLEIRVNEPNTQLEKILKKYSTRSWAFLTAWNPESNPLDKKTNLVLNKQLKEDLSGYKFFIGSGISTTEKWEPEESFFILGITLEQVNQLAKKYNQNAFLFGQINDNPSLILTR